MYNRRLYNQIELRRQKYYFITQIPSFFPHILQILLWLGIVILEGYYNPKFAG